ncbi:hypothetical protein GGR56DRAFT_686046 [Xylariaceae sp. FL0804]|nr:hypothetical protein GGR56DRAFT_686046 [Xylariaceae sp. FL0804]
MATIKKRTTIDAYFGASPAQQPKRRRVDDELDDDDKHDGSNETARRGGGGGGDGAVGASRKDGQSGTVDDDNDDNGGGAGRGFSTHATYPFAIPHLPRDIARGLAPLPERTGRPIADRPDLDLVYFQPYISHATARDLFRFLRAELPFYRVEYDIRRGGVSTHIRTPRWTTVFGVDDTSRFAPPPPSASSPTAAAGAGSEVVVDARTGRPTRYAGCAPRPLPACLEGLRQATEAACGDGDGDGDGCASASFNFCLVNYYASGADAISFHSDDERFLGARPAIASLSLGARRDFLMKPKPKKSEPEQPTRKPTQKPKPKPELPLKLSLASGDMVLMRGTTQANWLHSIPRRSGRGGEDGGRINITFRRALVRAGTENYYRYNVGNGPVYRWDDADKEMKLWQQQQPGVTR